MHPGAWVLHTEHGTVASSAVIVRLWVRVTIRIGLGLQIELRIRLGFGLVRGIPVNSSHGQLVTLHNAAGQLVTHSMYSHVSLPSVDINHNTAAPWVDELSYSARIRKTAVG